MRAFLLATEQKYIWDKIIGRINAVIVFIYSFLFFFLMSFDSFSLVSNVFSLQHSIIIMCTLVWKSNKIKEIKRRFFLFMNAEWNRKFVYFSIPLLLDSFVIINCINLVIWLNNDSSCAKSIWLVVNIYDRLC